ncbi:Serine/threonine-protein phosphatase 6 regulatory ankyrin repeat subunit, partial [Globisporangium polare]
MPQQDFVQAVEKWSVLSHPNVVRLLGASHVCHPSVAVFEDISCSSLGAFVRAETHHMSLVWQKLYEAALGLTFLHERGVVLGALQSDSIWIGADGLAKIAPVGVSLFTGEETGDAREEEDIECWQSPEAVNGETPTFASDVYSFGKCVLAAVSGESARSDVQQAAVGFDGPGLDTHEVQQWEVMSAAQQQLVDE